MTLPWQLHWPSLVEATLVPLLVCYVLGLSQWFFRLGGQLRADREKARQELVESLLGADEAVVVQALSRLPGQERFAILVPLAISLRGEERARLALIAERLGLLARARGMLSSPRWAQRLAGIRTLSLLGGAQAPLEPLLDDPEPLVVAEAAAWVADYPTPARVEKVVALVRQPWRIGPFALKDALQRLGPAAEASLLAIADDLAPAQLLEVLHVACVSGYPSFRGRALEWLKADHPAVRSRACDLLSELGGEGVSEALQALLEDPDARPRARASVALGKLGWTAAGARLARLTTEDERWEVRWAAGLGLRLLGPEGMLYLHQLKPVGLGRLLIAAPDYQIGRWARD